MTAKQLINIILIEQYQKLLSIINGNSLVIVKERVILYGLVCESIHPPYNTNIYMVNFLVEVFRKIEHEICILIKFKYKMFLMFYMIITIFLLLILDIHKQVCFEMTNETISVIRLRTKYSQKYKNDLIGHYLGFKKT